VPAHKLEHDKRHCWKFRPCELLELKRDELTEPEVAIQSFPEIHSQINWTSFWLT